MTIFKRASSADIDFASLVTLLDQDLKIRDGDDHPFYAQYNKIDSIKHVIVCYVENVAVACGAFKEFDAKTVEIKRMFVQPLLRRKGIAHQVLNELEKWAAELNYSTCVLETGIKQPEAINLYQKAGYTVIENYGQYAGIENSVCMLKNIY